MTLALLAMNRALLAIAALSVLSVAPSLSQPSTNNALTALMVSNGVAIPPNVTFGVVTDRSATNWWMILEIDLRGWTDVTVKLSTNGFMNTDEGRYNSDAIVFRWTTADCRLNGDPSWERFETNWMPLAVMTWNAPHDSRYNWMTIGIRNSLESFQEWIDTHLVDPKMMVTDKMTIYIRQPSSWFHPTNRVNGIVLRQSATECETQTNSGGVQPKWQSIEPRWVNHDPRPRTVNLLFETPPHWGWVSIGAQHSQP